MVRPAGLIQWKILITSGIEPATFWLIAQCLNQLRRLIPLSVIYISQVFVLPHSIISADDRALLNKEDNILIKSAWLSVKTTNRWTPYTIPLLFNYTSFAISHFPTLQSVNSLPSRYVACPSFWKQRERGKKLKCLLRVKRLSMFLF
jgi:hypothetical protein